MFIKFDYRCKGCGFKEERFTTKDEVDCQFHRCGGNTVRLMTRLPAGPRTLFHYNDQKRKP